MEPSNESPENLPEHLSSVINVQEFVDIHSDIEISDPEVNELTDIVEALKL